MKKSIHRMTSVVEAVALLSGQMFASSHSDAELSKQDPQTKLTDVYAFIDGNGNLNFIINVRPFGEPGDGVLYDRFADDAMYTINIANPATGHCCALITSNSAQYPRLQETIRTKPRLSRMSAEPRSARFKTLAIRIRTSPKLIR